ncbi:endonuclease domain-containing protein [Microbacterium sp. NC79]|uniref:endonuclease domain-containing protein n=1 Tax=Microbacterium sp. NC79 TaxID=2851009 RepID=UPI001C2B8DD1|nr:DUF559 domain-containing protein [Microbacterium sp. NC79]MBV0895006.1 DUF559 domain-containing protein [Microbacterium sp. NC79]
MDPREALARLGGVARTHQMAAYGVTMDEALASAEAGAIARLRKGVYALDSTQPVAVAAAHGGALTCVSALAMRGVWVLDVPLRAHVELGVPGRRHSHRNCTCVDHHTAPRTSFGIVSVFHALLTAWRCLSVESYFAAYESAWYQGFISDAERASIRKAVPTHIRQWLARARGDAGSGLESIFRFRLMLEGIELESQVEIETVGRVDFRCGRVLIEVDGRRNHESAADREKDLRRDNAAIRLGYFPLRFSFSEVIRSWPQTLQTVLAAIEATRWEPEPAGADGRGAPTSAG